MVALADGSESWPVDDLLEADDLGRVPKASVSVKVTALAPSFTMLTSEQGLEQATRRLLPVLEIASARNVSVWFDMENYEVKALTHVLFRKLLERPEMKELHAGIVVQAYLRDSAQDLESLASWAAGRAVPPGVRLVKGSYWDTETVEAEAESWSAPVFERKAETDANFERLVRILHSNHGTLRAAFGSHNLRSLAVAMTEARRLGIPDNGYEIQLLYGMAEPVHDAMRRLGARLRVYSPMGELVPGMAYLVRRLLENTSNESFVRHHFAEGEALDELLVSAGRHRLPGPQPFASRPATDPAAPAPYRPEPLAEWRRPEVKDADGRRDRGRVLAPAAKGGGTVAGKSISDRPDVRLRSTRPIPDSVVSEATACGPAEVDEAAADRPPARRRAGAVCPPSERAAVLFGAADRMRKARYELAALEVREAGKGWADADADVCEAVDYCEYYARRMLELDEGGAVQSPPGEENRLVYHARGVAAVISPWNFPLAIPAGMTCAALVAGKRRRSEARRADPCGRRGARLGASRVRAARPTCSRSSPATGPTPAHRSSRTRGSTSSPSPARAMSVSASSRPRAAATTGRRSIVRVIAELGGKNAIVVDSDADLDEVVPAVISSTFGFAGQKCSAASRLVCVESVHDAVVERVVEAARSLVVGPTRLPGSQMGPVIDAEAHAEAHRCAPAGQVSAGRSRCGGPTCLNGDTSSALSWSAEWTPPRGWHVTSCSDRCSPTFSVPDLDAAVDLANSSDYALTAGIFSRSPAHVRAVTSALRAGNVYVNRTITGAVVGRQPFGGSGLSGVGSKAGGPDYLLQFSDPQVISENTVRQGFASGVGSTGKSAGSARRRTKT